MATLPSESTFHAQRTVYDPRGGVVYVPFVSDDGRVGYRVTDTLSDAGAECFIYLNPSDSSDDGVPNVFLYVGGENDPAYDAAELHYDLRDQLGRPM